jgi:site-specific recombinase XerD
VEERAGTSVKPKRTIRHARASMLVASGASIVEVAAQLGHSPSMCLNT